jgi:hypothetical protein
MQVFNLTTSALSSATGSGIDPVPAVRLPPAIAFGSPLNYCIGKSGKGYVVETRNEIADQFTQILGIQSSQGRVDIR